MKKEVYLILLYFFIVSFVINVYAFYSFSNSLGRVRFEQIYFHASSYDLAISLFVIMLSLILLITLFFLSTNFNKVKSISIPYNVGYIIFAIQMSFITYNIWFELNTAGTDSYGKAPWYLSYFFIFLSSDTLFSIYLFTAKSSKLRSINSLVYFISTLQRGWMSGIVIIIVNFFLESKITLKQIMLSSILVTILILCLPLLVNAKWYLRTIGYDFQNLEIHEIVNFDGNYILSLISSLDYIINRFQILSTTTYIYINSFEISAYQDHFKPFYLDGIIALPFFKLFSIDIQTLNSFIVTNIVGLHGANWNVNTGFLSWLFISPIYAFILPIYTFILILVCQKNPIMQYGWRIIGFSLFMVLSKLHVGWFGAYINWLISLYVFYFLVLQLEKKQKTI